MKHLLRLQYQVSPTGRCRNLLWEAKPRSLIESQGRSPNRSRPSIEGEARVEGVKRPRIEGEARTEGEAREKAGGGAWGSGLGEPSSENF